MSLSFPAGSKSHDVTLDLNLACSPKCFDISVAKIHPIIVFLAFLNSAGSRFLKKLYLS